MDDDVSDNVVIARFDQFLLSGDFSADQPAARCHERRHKVLDVGLGIRIKVGVVKEERLERHLVSKNKTIKSVNIFGGFCGGSGRNGSSTIPYLSQVVSILPVENAVKDLLLDPGTEPVADAENLPAVIFQLGSDFESGIRIIDHVTRHVDVTGADDDHRSYSTARMQRGERLADGIPLDPVASEKHPLGFSVL